MYKIMLGRHLPVAFAASLLASAVGAAEPQSLNFVACPVFQDTNTVPCWVAEYEGETYFLGIQTDSGGWTPPLQGHKVLVEGVTTSNPRVCGGIVLTSAGKTPFDRRPSGKSAGVDLPQPPVTSPLRELDSSCRTILPETAKYNTIEPRRGPGPSPAPTPRAAPDPAAVAQRQALAEAEKPRPPFAARTFPLHYEFDSELAGLTINGLQQALKYAADINAKTIEIVSYRASVLLSNGQQLQEIPTIARRRAKELEDVTRMYGLPPGTTLKVRAVDEVQMGTGHDDWSRRRSDIIVSP